MGKSRQTIRAVPNADAPSEETLRAALETMLTWHRDWDNITLGHRKQRDFWMIWGLVSHTIAQAEAALVLVDDARLALCSEVNARVAFEHALLAQYVHLHPEGHEKLGQLTAFQSRRLAESLKDFPMDEGLADAQRELLSQPKIKRPDIADMATLLKAFDPTGTLYVPYKLLCQTVHPSGSTMTRYMVLDEDEHPRQMRQYALLDDKRAVVWTIALAVLLALGVQEDLRRAKPNKPRLRDLAATIGMTPLLELAATKDWI